MTRDHWESLADILGPSRAARLYGELCANCGQPVDWPEGVDHWDGCEPFCAACCPQCAGEALNSAESVQGLYTPTGGLVWSPRVACVVAGILAGLTFGIVAFAAIHHRDTSTVPTELEPCALVLTRSGQVCR